LGGEEPVLHDPRDLLCLRVGDVHQDKGWSTAGDERWRRPWRRTQVLGEGPANRDGRGAHEHHGSVEMHFPYPIWLETGRKVVVDGEVDLGRLRRAAARGRIDSGQGMSEARSEWVRRLVGRERKLLGAGIWAGGAAVENSGERLAVGLVVTRKKKGKTAERKGSGLLYRGALLCGREGEGEQSRGQAQVDGRRRRALRACVAAARHRRPGVAGREGASRGGAGGGRSSQATHCTRKSGAEAAGPRESARRGRR
jgi:hypothetical protein